MTEINILYNDGGIIRPIHLNPPSNRYLRTEWIPQKGFMMDRSAAMFEIMTILNEAGRLIPGDRAHGIVTEYMNFKIDRMGPEKALEDVRHTKEHLVAQIQQLAM